MEMGVGGPYHAPPRLVAKSDPEIPSLRMADYSVMVGAKASRRCRTGARRLLPDSLDKRLTSPRSIIPAIFLFVEKAASLTNPERPNPFEDSLSVYHPSKTVKPFSDFPLIYPQCACRMLAQLSTRFDFIQSHGAGWETCRPIKHGRASFRSSWLRLHSASKQADRNGSNKITENPRQPHGLQHVICFHRPHTNTSASHYGIPLANSYTSAIIPVIAITNESKK